MFQKMRRSAQAMSDDRIREVLQRNTSGVLSLLDENGNKVFTLFHLLYTTSLDCRKAISSEISDYEDAIMVETAIRSEMDCIVTRNVKDSTKSFVKVREPSAFLKLLEAENETE